MQLGQQHVVPYASRSTVSRSPSAGAAEATHVTRHHPSGSVCDRVWPSRATYASAMDRPSWAKAQAAPERPCAFKHVQHTGCGSTGSGAAPSPAHVQCHSFLQPEQVKSDESSRGTRCLHATVWRPLKLVAGGGGGAVATKQCSSNRTTSRPSTALAASCAGPCCRPWFLWCVNYLPLVLGPLVAHGQRLAYLAATNQ